MMAPLDRLRFDRGAVHLYGLGPRAVAELLVEVAENAGCAQCILHQLARYERLTPGMVRAAGADRFPPRPLRLTEQALMAREAV